MIAIVHSIYSQSVHAPALDAGLMDTDAERYCRYKKRFQLCKLCINALTVETKHFNLTHRYLDVITNS